MVGPPLAQCWMSERQPAPGEAAAAVSIVKHPPQSRRNGSCQRADLHHPAVRVVAHDHSARVARQASGRLGGHVRAGFERRLAGRIGVLQHGCIDVDDHLVALARRARIHPVMKRRLGDQAQRVRLLLGHGRRLHRHVGRKRFRGTQHVAIATPRPAETAYAARVEGSRGR